MDSVKRAIWGEGNTENDNVGQEPISGQTGNTAAGEPYDAGNKEDINPTSTISSTTTGQQHPSNTGSTALPSYGSSMGSTALPGSATNPSHGGLPDPTTQEKTTGPTPQPDVPAAKEHQAIDVNREDTSAPNSSATPGTNLGSGSAALNKPSAGQQADSKGDSDLGPPAPVMNFSRKEIDDAAHVNISHENPHTIGADGKEMRDIDKNIEAEEGHTVGGVQGSEGHQAGDKEKGKMGQKIDKIKEKLHMGGKS